MRILKKWENIEPIGFMLTLLEFALLHQYQVGLNNAHPSLNRSCPAEGSILASITY